MSVIKLKFKKVHKQTVNIKQNKFLQSMGKKNMHKYVFFFFFT